MTAYSIHVLSCILHQSTCSSVVGACTCSWNTPISFLRKAGSSCTAKTAENILQAQQWGRIEQVLFLGGRGGGRKMSCLLERDRLMAPFTTKDRRERWWLSTYHWSCFWCWKNFALAPSHQKVLHYLKVGRKEIDALPTTPSKIILPPSLIR